MKTIRTAWLAVLSLMFVTICYGQTKGKNGGKILKHSKGSITFVVDEGLPEPKQEMNLGGSDAIAQWLIYQEQIPVALQHVVKTSFEKDQMAYMGVDNLYKCMVMAYADHRPLVLSPDMVWLIISQGFAGYVNAHSEEMRDQLVYHEGKMDIQVLSAKDVLSPGADWEKLLKDFSASIAQHTKGDVADLMVADFSTTGSTERVASQITLMETVKSYFTFWDFAVACGIPSITLKGTPADWEKVLEKARRLSKYKGLETWSKDLERVLAEFVKASEGEPDQKFWQDMIKKNRVKHLTKGGGCGPDVSTKLDGWFLTFFPTTEGETYEKVSWQKKMPSEMVRVSFNHVQLHPVTGEPLDTIPMELWAGFVGVGEDAKTHALIPKIGWLARVADEDAETLSRLEAKDNSWGLDFYLYKGSDKIPEILSKMKNIRKLRLTFSGIPVEIPAWMDNIPIEDFTISGKLSEEEKDKLRKRFPKVVFRE